MKRGACHYLKPRGQAKLPRSILAAVPIVDREALDGSARLKATGVWCCVPQVIGSDAPGGWNYYEPQWLRLEDFDHLVRETHRKHYPLWVVTHRLSELLSTTGLLSAMDIHGWRKPWFHDAGAIGIFRAQGPARRSVTFLQATNWWPVSVYEWAETHGNMQLDLESFDASPAGRAGVVCRVVRDMTELWWAKMDNWQAGGVRVTLSSQAAADWRAGIGSKRITVFRDPQFAAFVRSAYKGGRAEVGLIGERSGVDMCMIDVRSSYPFEMARRKFPSTYVGWVPEPSLEDVLKVARTHCLIADCTLMTETPAYAHRHNGETVFPVGVFRESLCTGSLLHAIESDHVHQVHSAMVWEAEDLFSEWVMKWWGRRLWAESHGNWIEALAAKRILNGLYGKLGATQPRALFQEPNESRDAFRQPATVTLAALDNCEYSPDDLPRSDWVTRNATVRGTEWSLFGNWQLDVPGFETDSSVPAIAAHITDWGRLRIWQIMQGIDGGRVHYVDTDGLICDAQAVSKALHGEMGPGLGQLRIVDQGRDLTVSRPKSYRFGTRSKQSGRPDSAIAAENSTWVWEQYHRLSSVVESGIFDGLPVTQAAARSLPYEPPGRVDGAGRVHPVVLS